MRGSAPIKIVSLVSSIAAPGCSVYESIVISVETKEKDTQSDS